MSSHPTSCFAWRAGPLCAAALVCVLTSAARAEGDLPPRLTPAATDEPARAARAGCAERPRDHRYRLADAVAHALCTDPRTRLSWALWQAEAAREQLERAAYWPTASASVSTGRGRLRLDEDGDTFSGRGRVFDTGLDLTWVLYDFGLRRANVEAAQLAVLAAAASHDGVVQEVYLATVRAFYALADAQDAVELLRASGQFTATLLERTQSRTDETEPLDALDLLQIKTSQASIEVERLQAEGTLARARGELASLLGTSPAAPLAIELEPRSDAAFDGDSVEALMAQALETHPGLRAARARVGAADAEVAAARLTGTPTLSAYHRRARSRDALDYRSREQSVGVQIEIPLFAGFTRRHREREAQALREAARAELRSVEQQTALEVWSSYQDLRTQVAALRANERFRDIANELLAAELAAFDAGTSDMFDVLAAESSAVEAASACQIGINAVRVARLRLAASLGRL